MPRSNYAWIATALVIGATIPQLLQVLKTWSVEDFNVYSVMMYMTANGLMAYHGYLGGDFGITTLNTCLFLFNSTILYVQNMPNPFTKQHDSPHE